MRQPLRITLVALLAVACGSHPPALERMPEPVEPDPARTDTASRQEPTAPPEAPPAPPAPPAPVNQAPELFAPEWKTAGVGETISFGVAAIDQDLDEVRTEVVAMPASASFDAITQTVTWTPTRKDMPAATFTIRATALGHTGPAAQTERSFAIAVAAKKQPAPVAPRQAATVEMLLTIRDPERLIRVNEAWPFDAFLARSAELFRATLPVEIQAKLRTKVDRKALFRSFLASLAEIHQNPRLDPSSKHFDRKAFGDPRAWRIVAVRPRIDKQWNELRVVYRAVKAPEPVFAMFRIRPTWDVPALPPEARAYNNKVFLGLVWKNLLTEDGELDDRPSKGSPRQWGVHVAGLVNDVLRHRDPAQPWSQAAFVALPTEARMGGGSARAADGSYQSGDGWAWSVMKPIVTPDGTSQAYVNMPIPGFWTQAVPSADGTMWVAKCAARFDPDDPKHEPGYEVLCRKAQGFVDQPELVDGRVISAKRDAANLFVEHKNVHAVAALPLDDGRRDHGEENGMTCAQCHIRNFGIRDYGDPATASPAAGSPRASNPRIATLNFQIVPSERWEAYLLEFMKDQECKGAKNFEVFLGKKPVLGCPARSKE